MHDHDDNRGDRGGSRDHHGDDRSHDHRQRGDERGPDRGGPGGPGTDTRFLQLEMSQVLYAEAEDVARPAFRALLLEAAKERMRERFGEEITALAQLAVDELLTDVQASFEIEERIQRNNEERRSPREKLREVLARRGRGGPRPVQPARRERPAARARRTR